MAGVNEKEKIVVVNAININMQLHLGIKRPKIKHSICVKPCKKDIKQIKFFNLIIIYING